MPDPRWDLTQWTAGFARSLHFSHPRSVMFVKVLDGLEAHPHCDIAPRLALRPSPCHSPRKCLPGASVLVPQSQSLPAGFTSLTTRGQLGPLTAVWKLRRNHLLFMWVRGVGWGPRASLSQTMSKSGARVLPGGSERCPGTLLRLLTAPPDRAQRQRRVRPLPCRPPCSFHPSPGRHLVQKAAWAAVN